MKGRKILLAFIISAVTLTSGCANGTPKTEEAKSEQKTTEENAVVPIKPITAKAIDDNPYMAKSDANVHQDCYNSDTTDEVLPVDIYPEINVSYEKVNPNASPAVFFDTYGHAVVPFQGGLAIRDINADETQTEGYFSPAKHDGGGYVIQSSYSFVDESNRLVCPTSNNHVLMLKATDDAGNVLPEFEKVLDIDIKAAAEEITGKTLDQNLLSVVFDYEGNLWFATGGFRIYPERKQQGAMGYISRAAIDAILKGEHVDLKESTFVYELEPGEGAENGIASSKEGAVILTNQNCYLLNAKDGVQVQWCTPYESVGAKDSKEGDETTGGGLTMDVSDKPGYNNMAIGMYAGNSGNTLYCPTGYLELLRLQDRFVYLPEMPYRKVDLDKAKRNVLTQEEFTEAGGKGNVAGWLNTITVENVHPNTTVAIRMKGIAGKADTFTLYAYDKENKLKEVPAELWHIQEEDKTVPDKLTEDTLYEVHVMVEDGGEFDLSDTEKEIKIAVILGNK